MEPNMFSKMEMLLREHKNRRKQYIIIAFLAVIVGFLTAYTLLMPAITAERETSCGMEEHIHSNSCYQNPDGSPVTIADCNTAKLIGQTGEGYADFVVHQHDDACYEEGELVCELPVIQEHRHGDSCYDKEGKLICGKDEIILHQHTSECYDESGALICGKKEVKAHQHTAECNKELRKNAELICTEAEHQHTEECFVEDEISPLALEGKTVTDWPGFKKAITDKNEAIVLGGDIDIAEEVTPEADLTIDLNGHTLTVSKEVTENMFTVNNGITLNIKDSQAMPETVSGAGSDRALYGNKAEYDKDTGKLTYYVTETAVNDSSLGSTTETLKVHEVQGAGRIICNEKTAFNVTGGTLNIKGGMICDGTNRAINMNGGTVNIDGGYICGFNLEKSNNDHGGAISATGGTVNIKGGVLAGNTSNGNGGAIAISGGTALNFTDGVISGNTAKRNEPEFENKKHNGGGGVYCIDNSKFEMSGGYLTNNTVEADVYFDGGGGAFISDQSSFTLNGGYITGNIASGGGGLRTNFGNKATFTMNGGFVSGNMARSTEGGGIAIDRDGTGTINGGHITNNRTNCIHWGGGGLFCADGATLAMKKVLVTENSAGGFGGGIAGCSTGKIYLYVNDGGATFDNKDMVESDSPHFVDDGIKKVDQKLCTKFFQEHGHKDFFCAKQSSVLGKMLGEGTANWSGSASDTPWDPDPDTDTNWPDRAVFNAVNIGADDIQTAMTVMGLESNPSETAKESAKEEAEVYVNGNYSNTHGGGILCNGDLIFGTPINIEVPAHLNVTANKSLIDEAGKKLGLEKNDFTFEIFEKTVDGAENILTSGACDENGTITLAPDVALTEGTHTLFLRESKENMRPEIKYDSTVYQITVNVKKDEGVKWYGDTKKFTYNIVSVKVEKSSDGKEPWTLILERTYNPVQNNVLIDLASEGKATFTNVKSEKAKTDITVKKVWEDGKPGVDEITVKLYHGNDVYGEVKLNDENNWTHSWTGLVLDDKPYHVEEVKVPGYTGKITTTQDDNGNTVITITNKANEYKPVLPETGGRGTGLFFIIGGIMVIGAVIAMLTRKRMSKEK